VFKVLWRKKKGEQMSVKFPADLNGPFWNRIQKEKISRRQYLKLLAALGGSAALSACAPAGLPPAPDPTPTAFEGYSIFHETIVEMPWTDIQQAAQQGAVVLLPIGIIEEHGPHMGLAPDIYATYNWCKMARHALEARGIKTLIAPPNYWGISPGVISYPGTFSVEPATLKAILYDLHALLHRWGFEYVFSFNAHGDSLHNRVYHQAVQEAHDQLEMGAYYVVSEFAGDVNKDYAVFFKNPPLSDSMLQHQDTHAGAFETAEMMAYFPKTVHTEIAKTLKPTHRFDPYGYWGDPASFDRIDSQEVKKWAEAVAENTAEAIMIFLKEKKH
jgi:creatinine amidohydrolase